MKIKTGFVTFLNFFDLGGEVKLEGISDEMEKFGVISSEFMGTYTKYWIDEGKLSLKVTIDDKTEVKIYPLGVVIVRNKVKVDNLSLEEVIDILKEKDDEVKENAKILFKRIGKAVKRHIFNEYEVPDITENYNIISFSEFDDVREKSKVSDVLKYKKEIVSILREEKNLDELTEEDITGSMQLKQVFGGRDMVITDWSSSFIFCSHANYPNILHMIELARMQLLELKVFDSLLDKMLKDVSKHLTFVGTPFMNKKITEEISKISSMRLEIMSYIEDIKNISKVTRNRIAIETYGIASKRFALDYWFSIVNNKIEKLDEIYKSASEKMETAKLVKLELAIVILIVIEIIIFIVDILVRR